MKSKILFVLLLLWLDHAAFSQKPLEHAFPDLDSLVSSTVRSLNDNSVAVYSNLFSAEARKHLEVYKTRPLKLAGDNKSQIDSVFYRMKADLKEATGKADYSLSSYAYEVKHSKVLGPDSSIQVFFVKMTMLVDQAYMINIMGMFHRIDAYYYLAEPFFPGILSPD